MRRPHPRFDLTRNAWVTRAGGKLTTLAKGPKNANTQAVAWDVFYALMARLGNPVPKATKTALSLGQLADHFGEWMQREVEANRMKAATLEYYRHYLQQFLDALGGNRPAEGLLPHELEMYKTSWHSVQVVQRMFNWGVMMGLLDDNPVRAVTKPDLGQRKRTLTPHEIARLLRTADRDFRPFLLTLKHTIARPQEVRALQWKHFTRDPVPMFVLTDFKSRKRRKDKESVRIIPLDDRMVRLLDRLARRQSPSPDDYVLVNRHKRPWSANAVRCRMRRLRERIGLGPDERGEEIVAYTLRHTSATRASARGIRDKVLAELMGHTSTRTTQRYQHLQAEHLAEAIQRANGRKGAQ